MRKKKIIITAVTMFIMAGQLIGCGNREEKADAKETAETTTFNSEEINSKVLSVVKGLTDMDIRAKVNEVKGEKMRETARATYQSIANQLTTDENTYVSEYIVLIDQGNTQEDTERSLLEKYKRTEQESEQQEYESENKPKPISPSEQLHFNNMEEGYVEIGGKRLWVDSNGYIFHEDKTTPFTMDEIDEVIGDSGTITVSKPSGTAGGAGTKEPEGGLSEEQSRRQAEEESRIQAVQDEMDEAINKGSEEVGSGGEMTSGANWKK